MVLAYGINMIASKKNIIKEYLDYLSKSNKAKSTQTAYKTDVLQFLDENDFQNIIDGNSIDKYIAILKQDYSTKTVSRKLNSISDFYAFLLSKKFIETNPINKVSYPKALPQMQKTLTKENLDSLIESTLDDARLNTILQVLINTGIKIGEVVNLKVSDLEIDKKKKVLKLEDREIEIIPKLFYVLKLFLVSEHNNKCEYLFYTSQNKPIHVRNLRTSIVRAMQKLKLKNVSVNDLRNTFIVKQLDAGNSIDFVQRIAGHKTPLSTEKYLKLCGNYQNKKIERIIE